MFIPKVFEQTNRQQLIELIQAYPLATVIFSDNSLPVACHIPVLYVNDERGERLIGHVHRSNPLWQHTDKPWLVIFHGANHYISANWYPSKQQTHKEAPTYNYQAVHITVQATLIEDLPSVKQILSMTTDYFEEHLATQIHHHPWKIDDAPSEFIDKMCTALVAFEMSIVDMQAQFKLSQNKSDENRQGVIDGLGQLDTDAARQMAMLVKHAK